MSHTNHVDGEIWVNAKGEPPTHAQRKVLEMAELRKLERAADRVLVEPTDLDYRTAALNAAIQFKGNQPFYSEVIKAAEKFEPYLRGEAA